MSRLFVTDRELRFMADINRELIKDIVGQVIYYYAISATKTVTHDVYGEAIKKIFDAPVKIDALVDATFHNETEIQGSGVDNQYSIEVFIQWRDLNEKGINVVLGDFFSYADVFFEIIDHQYIKTIYGEAEHKTGIKISGVRARQDVFEAPLLGPTDISYTDPEGTQHAFYQQRGFARDANGEDTNDVRELVRDGVLDAPLTGPKQISPKGETKGDGSSFYGDEE